jgi:hypothetical protein
MKSNCLFAAVAIWLRIGGRIHWEKPNRFCVFGHFCVVVRNRTIELLDDMTIFEMDNWHWWRLLWYKGSVHRITRKCFTAKKPKGISL